MNTRGGAGSGSTLAFSVSFNRSKTSFAVAHDDGYSVFRTRDGEKVSTSSLPALRHAGMVGDSRYVAVASLFGKQPGLTKFDVGLYDAKEKVLVVSVDKVKDARAVHLTEGRLVVVCRTITYLYDVEEFQRLSSLETVVNDDGVCSIGVSKMVIPGRSLGQVQVVDLETGRAQQIITAHLSAIKSVELSEDEKYVATASESGTLFRIFILPNGDKVAELRRGIETAKVFDIKMSPDNAFLAATSERGTIHVFGLGSQPNEQPEATYAAGSRESGSPEPIPIIPRPPRKASMSSNVHPVGSASFSPGSPARKSSGTSHMMAGSPSEYVMVDSSPTAPRGSPKNVPIGKYSQLSKLPFAPKFIKAHYPDASNVFDMGPIEAAAQAITSMPTRGQIKWLDEDTLIVVRVQPTVLWEKFKVERSALDGSVDFLRKAYSDLAIP